MEPRSFGRFLSALRKSSGLTQKQLAEKLDVSDKTISRWERDETEPDLASIPVLADIFGITADELLRGMRNKRTHNMSAENSLQPDRCVSQVKANQQITTIVAISLVLAGSMIAVLFAFVVEYGIRTGDFARVNFRLVGFTIGTLFYIAAGMIKTVNIIHALSKMKSVITDDVKRQTIVDSIANEAISFGIFILTAIAGTAAVMLTNIDFISWVNIGALLSTTTYAACTLCSWYLVKPTLAKKGILINEENNSELKALRNSVVVLHIIIVIILIWNALAFGFYNDLAAVVFILCIIPCTIIASLIYRNKKSKIMNNRTKR